MGWTHSRGVAFHLAGPALNPLRQGLLFPLFFLGFGVGSIESGKLGDLVVLSGDYFDPPKVADQDIRTLKSLLTVVGGKIVYNTLN